MYYNSYQLGNSPYPKTNDGTIMLNKNFNPDILGYYHRPPMNLIGMLLLAPHHLSGKLMLSRSKTFHLPSVLFSIVRKLEYPSTL